MTAAPAQHRAPWADADDARLLVLCRSVDAAPRTLTPTPKALALVADAVAEIGRTIAGIQTRIRVLHGRGDVGARAAQRTSIALAALSRMSAPAKVKAPKRDPAEPREPLPPLPALRRGPRRDLGPRPDHAPPAETWPDGVDPWRVATQQRGIGASDATIAHLIGQLCDPRCAPARTHPHAGSRGGLWSPADVRILLGS